MDSLLNITHLERSRFAWQSAKSHESIADQGVWGRFWAKVAAVPSGCLEWTSARNSAGYGMFSWSARYGRTTPAMAHRVAWELVHGPIVNGLSVLHHCDNPTCVNPDHLFLGTHTDNMRDASQKGRLSVPRPTRQKVTPEQVGRIVALVASGRKAAHVAREFGISRSLVGLILKGSRRQYDRPDASLERTA